MLWMYITHTNYIRCIWYAYTPSPRCNRDISCNVKTLGKFLLCVAPVHTAIWMCTWLSTVVDMCMRSLHALIVACGWTSQRSWDGVWLNRSAREVMCKTNLEDWILRYVRTYLYLVSPTARPGWLSEGIAHGWCRPRCHLWGTHCLRCRNCT